MLFNRIIPCLQLVDDSLVKTVKYGSPSYIGDPVNTVRIFNELEVDELCFLDIRATREGRHPNLSILRGIANESFMPMSYGGGISDISTAKEVLTIGFEKIVLNSAAVERGDLVSRLADQFGSQSLIAAIDVKKDLFGRYRTYTRSGSNKLSFAPEELALRLAAAGAGEILLTAIDREGTWGGMDNDLIQKVCREVRIPVIAHGGAGCIADIGSAIESGAAAVALGSMVVYQAKGLGVLVNFPDRTKLAEKIASSGGRFPAS